MLEHYFVYFCSREVLQEDDEGSLQATIDEIIQKAKRKRYTW